MKYSPFQVSCFGKAIYIPVEDECRKGNKCLQQWITKIKDVQEKGDCPALHCFQRKKAELPC